MIKSSMLPIASLLFLTIGCSSGDDGNGPTGLSELQETPKDTVSGQPEVPDLTDAELLDLTQRTTLAYFWDYAEADSGAARERFHPNDPARDAHVVTTGGTGFGLLAIIVGMERGIIAREEGVARLTRILSFLETADRFHGAWPHWLDGRTGKTIPFSPKDDGGDLVETAFLVQGLICVYEYFKEGNTDETGLADMAAALWKGVEWDWYTQGRNALYWHWSPNFGFEINLELKGYNETLIAYVLAASSPDHAINMETYDGGWASGGNLVSGETSYDIPLVVDHAGDAPNGGPLFWAHYSYLGLDPRSLSDDYVNYGEVTVNHSRINYRYCVDNPKGFADYGTDCWGLTASYTRNNDGGLGYNAHSPSNDIGVITPTAALSSMPYTPEESMRALRYFYGKKDVLLGPAGFYDAFSPDDNFWVAEAYLAIDQGPIISMIENHRTGLLWRLFMQNIDVQNGLDRLGFVY